MNNKNKPSRINWIEDMGTSGCTEELRRGLESALSGITVDLLFNFDYVRAELRCGDNGIWIIDGGYPTKLSGLVQVIKEKHPKARIIVYRSDGGEYAVPNIDAQVDITKTTSAGLAQIVSQYLN